MPDLTYIPHTKRRKMTQARAARIYLANNGVCVNCGVQIRVGEEWFIEHPESLAQGGSDKDEDLGPAHTRCKPAKDAADAKSKAKRDRIITKGWAGKKRSGFQTNRDGKFKKRMDGTTVLR